MLRNIPKLIGLCGNPNAGKTTAATIIGELYGHVLADDGLPLRQIGMKYLGLTEDQVFTQAGKLEQVILNDRQWTVREILGEIGNAFEEKFGGDIIPMMSRRAQDPNQSCVFGSVRREQGLYWRNAGALVLEIVNPLAPESIYEFDKFNSKHCHATIMNDGLARGLSHGAAYDDLKLKLQMLIEAL